MSVGVTVTGPQVRSWSDEAIVARVVAGEAALFEVLMRRHNQRIYRIVRSILDDDGEAEDVMQDAYVRAYQHQKQFESRSTFVTWLTRIAMHEAFARAGRLKRHTTLDCHEVLAEMMLAQPSTDSPERNVANQELHTALQAAILTLPPKYRSIIMLRDVEEMSTAEAASAPEISEETVKVRLHRARAQLRRALYQESGQCASELFTFPATCCDRIVTAVLARI